MLTIKQVANIQTPGRYLDGEGLSLIVEEGAKGIRKTWEYRYTLAGRTRAMGLGSWPEVSLAAARDILRVLKNTAVHPGGFWYERPPTAKRCQEMMKAVFDYAIWHEWYPRGINPATWKGYLDKGLPSREKVRAKKHHPFLPWQQIGDCMEFLREVGDMPVTGNNLLAISAQVLQFQILTAARPKEAREARWSEIRLDDRLWVLPEFRMKEGRRHEVPLSDAALAVLAQAAKRRTSDWVFGGRGVDVVCLDSVWRLLQDLNYVADDGRPIAAHGFRSTFSEWANNTTSYDWQLIEMALAHEIKGSVRGSYFHGTMTEQRRPLMEDWGKFCSKPWQPAEIIPLHRKTSNE
jgi:integrase